MLFTKSCCQKGLFYYNLLASIFFVGYSFNLEERAPLIKHGARGSLFGLSVAEHHIQLNSHRSGDALILVGAPVAAAQDYQGPNSVNPGALYKCEISSSWDDCETVAVDNSVNTAALNNSDQWLGIAVKSQKPGGKVAVCAHRYTFREILTRGIIAAEPQGRCYMLENDLTMDTSEFTQRPCDGEPKSHNAFGYCQAGTSFDFANDETDDVIMGLPGTLNWQGSIQSQELNPALDVGALFGGGGGIWVRDVAEIKQNSYLGFSVASGHLISGTKLNFVAGAPRANDTGIVAIFEKNPENAIMKEILHGEILASSYGYEVKVFDFTGDGREDLIVGAPQYYDREKKIGGAVYIYINKGTENMGPDPTKILYGDMESAFGSSITNLGDLNMDGTNDIAIGAPGANGGIGAVFIYHGNDDPNEGVNDEPTQVLNGKDINNTAAGILQYEMKGFGYSLSGGLDMDFNGYPDLLIGSLSDTAVLYRTRPVVDVHAFISPSVSTITINPDLAENTVIVSKLGEQHKLVTYNISLCMNYTSSPDSFDEPVDIEYTLKLDAERLAKHLSSRATFIPLESQAIKTDTMQLFPQSQQKVKCTEIPVYVMNKIQDKLSPIDMSATFDVLKKEINPDMLQGKLLSIDNYPIFNKNVANITTSQVNISKNCGPDEICKSKLAYNARYVILPKKSKKWLPLSTGEDGDPLLLVGNQDEIGIEFDVSNPHPAEDAHQAKLFILLPDFLIYVGFLEQSAMAATVSCNNAPGNTSLVVCELGNPFRTDSSLLVTVRLENDPRLYEMDKFETRMKISTSSTQPKLDYKAYPVSVRVQVSLSVDGFTNADQLQFSGEVKGESVIKTPQDAGSIVSHTYEILNYGNNDVDDVHVNISWPQQISNGKWLFYLLDFEISDAEEQNRTCFIPEELINPLNLPYESSPANLASTTIRRRKRQADSGLEVAVKIEESSRDPPSSSFQVLKCSGGASCLNFTCQLGTVVSDRKVFVKLTAVAWNSTFLEEYYGVAEVRVFSNAQLWMERSNVRYDGSSQLTTELATSLLAHKIVQPEGEIKWWIVAVATLAGVVLLVIIVLVLWRCGFFKRRRDFGDYHKARRHKQASQKADETSDRMLY
ncbi:integrin alpha-6-like [Clavelina lepadiformis]|uniref:Integrin alpha-2 domain-containing protein n=1 Tax=Clavelina lepadiformis TaxID=159417 RepID=A0ABP0GTI1_CLALP